MEPASRKLAALSVFGTFAFFSPLALAFSRKSTVFGLPLLPAYFFGIWAFLVVAAWFISRRRNP